MSEPVKFPRSVVLEVLIELLRMFDPRPAWSWDGNESSKPVQRPHALCELVCAVGGYRRGKPEMKDLELLYIPRRLTAVDPGDMFGAESEVDVTEQFLAGLRAGGVLAPRLNSEGHEAWGPRNKLAVHVTSGLPIDLFAATAENYFNRLVVTTGPKESNVRIAKAALAKGWEWEVYQPGFVPAGGKWDTCPRERRTMRSEREVFEFVGLDYLPPEERR